MARKLSGLAFATMKPREPGSWGYRVSKRPTARGWYRLTVDRRRHYAQSREALVILANRIAKVIRYWEEEGPGCGWVTKITREERS